jgi:pimeloyl-ACP methyl ester carboxylesterase
MSSALRAYDAHSRNHSCVASISRSASIDGVIEVELPELSVVALTWGPDDGPLALLVHGFPDTAWTWRHVGPALAEAGWRVVAPFSRGYAPTDRAPDGNYQVGALVRDVVDLHAALGGDSGSLLVGHDWGAMTAYGVGAFAPMLFGRIVAMSLPPMPTLQRAFRGRAAIRLGLRQARNSWYVVANQLPGVSESAFGPLARRLWADWSPGYDGAVDVSHVREAIRDPERTAAAIGYYRAMLQPDRNGPTYAVQQAAAALTSPKPYLYLHGTRDGALGAPTEEDVLANLAPGSRAEIIDGVGHFLQLEKPDVVNDLVIEWLTT